MIPIIMTKYKASDTFCGKLDTKVGKMISHGLLGLEKKVYNMLFMY